MSVSGQESIKYFNFMERFSDITWLLCSIYHKQKWVHSKQILPILHILCLWLQKLTKNKFYKYFKKHLKNFVCNEKDLTLFAKFLRSFLGTLMYTLSYT